MALVVALRPCDGAALLTLLPRHRPKEYGLRPCTVASCRTPTDWGLLDRELAVEKFWCDAHLPLDYRANARAILMPKEQP